jgi:large subunit ribosomal protein L13
VKTYSPTVESVKRDWYVLDMKEKNLGRTAAEIARMLTGKNKPIYSTNIDTGDFVIVVNADKFSVTGNRMTKKLYRRHSGYPGGFKEFTMKELMVKHPLKILELAVMGMLPKNRLRAKRIKRLKLYTGENHPHIAQQPIPMEIKS